MLLLKAANLRRTCRNTWMLTKGAAKIPHPKLHHSHCCNYLHAKRHHWTSNNEIWRLTTNCWNRRTSMQQNGCTSSLCEWRNCHSKKEHLKLAARMQIRLPKAEDSTKIQKKQHRSPIHRGSETCASLSVGSNSLEIRSISALEWVAHRGMKKLDRNTHSGCWVGILLKKWAVGNVENRIY